MAKNMTTGPIPRQLVSFTIPLILGNLFQLTYNAADSIIVGRYAGTKSLAAVGTANPIMNIIVFFIVGICMGASILMSQLFGAGDEEKFKREVSTTLIVGVVFTIITSILGAALTKPILSLIHTPAEILEESALYLQVIFMGLIFTFLYNLYGAALRSIGDSKTPIIFLIIASLINVGLDLLFVGGMQKGVVGAAVATVIAQCISSILCILYVYKKIPLLQLKRKDFIIDYSLLAQTINYSWASAMQQTCLYIGKVFVQGAVNPLGVNSIAAFNAVNRIDDFAFTPQQSIANSMSVFIAQNRGAGKEERIKTGFKYGMLMETIYWCCLVGIVYFSASSVMKLFVPENDSHTIVLGISYLQIMAFMYLLPAYTNGLQGFFRGMGALKITLASTFIQMLVRVIFSYIFAPRFGIVGIAFACLAGWTAMLLYEVPTYLRYQKKSYSKV